MTTFKVKSGSGQQIQNISGCTFGCLLVLWPAGWVGHLIHWACQCACGNVLTVTRGNLLRNEGRCKSCSNYANIRHGQARTGKSTSEYRAWMHARERCNNPNEKTYSYYGGRGIKFLFETFDQFFSELGFKPSPQHSIDRINNDGNYAPGNVRWATKKEQRANQRRQMCA
jgi:hypothetical protein